MFPFVGKYASNLVDPLDLSVLSQWAPQKQEMNKMCTWERSNRKMDNEKLKINKAAAKKLNLSQQTKNCSHEPGLI